MYGKNWAEETKQYLVNPTKDKPLGQFSEHTPAQRALTEFQKQFREENCMIPVIAKLQTMGLGQPWCKFSFCNCDGCLQKALWDPQPYSGNWQIFDRNLFQQVMRFYVHSHDASRAMAWSPEDGEYYLQIKERPIPDD
eukprot:TRINITY_DN4515_c0_g1_i1.p1 TRINITY_DN4515_c0_g1~~TRINITY_DN4515_c0_g1_i1.p1  ORF type:complete len:138 (-),score=4.00 TRINITY_DN4515_c0_g1_i1:74-487(-)